jgi:adenine deaminase
MLKERIRAAAKQVSSDLVLVNINIVDVFSQDVFTADVAVSGGYFVGIGDYHGYGKKEFDGTGLYVIPGFIDAHAHIESSLVTPVEYSNCSLPHGVTGVVCDPHEIANVAGVAGIEFIIANSRHVPMDFYVMLPSCVPATSFEHGGAVLTAKELRPLYEYKEVRGLAEVMDFAAVLETDPGILQKIEDAEQAGYRIDGHAAGFGLDQLNAYGAAHIYTDHECDSGEGLKDRVRRGIYTLVREGTVCKDLLKLLPAINEKNAPMLCFATDDKHIDELCDEGGVDYCVRLAIRKGMKPATAVQIASLNCARCYGIKERGAIAPGYRADFSIVRNLYELTLLDVYKDGIPVAREGAIIKKVDPAVYPVQTRLVSTVKIPEVTSDDLAIEMGTSSQANIIEVVADSVVSNHLIEEVDVASGFFIPNTANDQLKIGVIERHGNSGNIAAGIVKGFRLQRGAIATTIAHDSHNIIAIGTNDGDIIQAVSLIGDMQGGIVAVDDGKLCASLRLEICGVMASGMAEDVVRDLQQLHRVAENLAPGCSFNPFLALSFMSLVVIPHLKICDSGLFDVSKFKFIPVSAGV